MSSAFSEIKRILMEFNARYDAKMSAVISRSGVPIAWSGHDELLHVEDFATLAATLLGASEAIYTGLNRTSPRRVIIESDDGMLMAAGIGAKAFVIALTPARTREVDRALEAVTEDVRTVLRGSP